MIIKQIVYTHFNMTKNKQKKEAKKENNVLIKFLKQTKEGKFAPIDKASLKYSRLEDTVESINVSEDNYYYSLS